jgi:uncharacterized protein (DUF2236 family)
MSLLYLVVLRLFKNKIKFVMAYFVKEDSIVRKIWGKGDTILFIFAGASAEFALNKAVDWLYFTGRLPADPLGRLFSTVSYARLIVFSEHEKALKAIDKITAIHQVVEHNRGAQIPDWAYRDVLFMLIDYSIRSFELLERKLTAQEKLDTFEVFNRMGARMGLKGLPANYPDWVTMRAEHLQEDLICSDFTLDLYRQYRKHLGRPRYEILKQAQIMVVPRRVSALLSLGNLPLLKPVLMAYKFARLFKIDQLLRNAILPQAYKAQIKDLDVIS